jgi:hypothetical protein
MVSPHAAEEGICHMYCRCQSPVRELGVVPIYGLFDDNSLDCIASNDWNVSEWLIGKDMEGSGCGPIWGSIRHLPGRTEVNTEHVSQDNRSQGSEPPEAGALSARRQRSVWRGGRTFGIKSYIITNSVLQIPLWIADYYSTVFWDITVFSPLNVNQRFGGTHGLHLQARRISQAKNQREAESKPGSSVDFQRTTRRYIPEDRILHNHRCENLTFYRPCIVLFAKVRRWTVFRTSNWFEPAPP